MQIMESIQIGQPEASTILVERLPVKDGTKLSSKTGSWEETIGLGWLLHEECD